MEYKYKISKATLGIVFEKGENPDIIIFISKISKSIINGKNVIIVYHDLKSSTTYLESNTGCLINKFKDLWVADGKVIS